MKFFDDRSALSPRTTGWERYARELAPRIVGGGVEALGLVAEGSAGRVRSDWYDVPRRVRGADAVYFPTFPPSALALKSARSTIYTLHDLTWWTYPALASTGGRYYYRHLAKRAVERADVIVTDSHAVRQEVLSHFRLAPDRVEVVYPGVKSPVNVTPARRARPYFLTVGTQEPRKNLKRLTQAYSDSGLSPDFDLVIVGRKGWGDSTGVTIVSGVDDETLWALYAGATALILPSLYEGFGLPIIEAFAMGTPVGCSDIPVFREVSKGMATYFDPLSVDQISGCLIRMAASDPGVDREARVSMTSSYTWEAAAFEARALLDRF